MRKPKDIIIKGKTLEQILIDHEHWINNDVGWENKDIRADLCYADLRNADLRNANLRNANLCYANLCDADLCDANLRNANLRNANLRNADLCYADLRNADLCYADLRNADLRNANLCYADLCDANLRNADLRNANLCYANLRNADLCYADLRNADLCDANLRNAKGNLIDYRKGKILTEDIIGYKKCRHNIIVTLKIPRGAIVFSINGSKCRTNKAKVIDIDGADRAYSTHKYMTYYVGDEFSIYDFNCEYNVECGEGIHFFTTREGAENY